MLFLPMVFFMNGLTVFLTSCPYLEAFILPSNLTMVPIPCQEKQPQIILFVIAIASQLVRNGKYEAVDCKSSQLVSQEVSDIWRATTPNAVNISDNFSQREFAAALQHLKPGKALGPDSICSELILHAGAVLKSWLHDFLSSCLC